MEDAVNKGGMSSTTSDFDTLKKNYLAIDRLIEKEYRDKLNVCRYIKKHNFYPFTSLVTLELVRDAEVKRAAREYIYRLMSNKEKYGFLYFLNTQRLIVPLNLQFNGELVIDSLDYEAIISEIENIGKDIISQSFILREITRIELLYFYTMLVNPHLNWITLDYLVRGNRSHDYLISARTLQDCPETCILGEK